MRILFIRHGQTPANVAGILETSVPGPGLTDLGHRQAEAVAEALASEPISAIYVSRLRRTHLTAAPLAGRLGIEPVEMPGLHEIEAGELEGRSDRSAVRSYLGTLAVWGDGDLDRAMPGGPTGNDFFARFDGDLERIATGRRPDETVAVVSHGAAIRVWCGGRPVNVDPTFVTLNELDNTGVVVVSGSPADGWVVESWMGEPLGGAALEDDSAADPTGEPL